MSRDEIKFIFRPKDKSKFDGLDVFDHQTLTEEDEAFKFMCYVETTLDTLRDPITQHEPMQMLLKATPLSILLDNFSRIPKNILILGADAMTLAFAKQETMGFTTAVTSNKFEYCGLVSACK
jgi:hypothetical protein